MTTAPTYSERKPRIALLIDADNVPPSKIEEILDDLAGFGETSIRRAYGNWTQTRLRGWAEKLHAQAIRPMQQYDYSKGKNASDMAMVVDAMALLYTERPDAFAIASSDADFTPLVMHLREKGLHVYGYGQAKTPEPFQSACSRFTDVDQLEELDGDDDATESAGSSEPRDSSAAEPSAKPKRASTAQLRSDGKLISSLRRAVNSSADETGWARVSTVGNHISNRSSFDSRNYGYASLTKLMIATDLFELRDEGTTAVSVRDKPAKGKHAKKATSKTAKKA